MSIQARRSQQLFLRKNEIAVCKISLADVIVVDEFNLHKTMGERILIDRVTNMTSACGVVREVNETASDVKEVDAAFRAELNNQKPVVVEAVLSDKINVDFLKKVEKELLLDSKHVYLYVPAEGEDYTNVVTHLVNAGIVVILALSKALILRLMAQKCLQAGSLGLTPLLWMWLSLLRRMRRLGEERTLH